MQPFKKYGFHQLETSALLKAALGAEVISGNSIIPELERPHSGMGTDILSWESVSEADGSEVKGIFYPIFLY